MGRTGCTEPQCLYKGALYCTLYWGSSVGVVTRLRNELSSVRASSRRRFELFLLTKALGKLLLLKQKLSLAQELNVS